MNLTHLVLRTLAHTPMRTFLTLCSLTIAFVLFMLLRSISSAFSGGVSLGESAQRLMLDAKYSMTDNVPVTHMEAIRQLDEVASLTNMSWFGGYYQHPDQNFAKAPVDHTSFFNVFPQLQVSAQTLHRWQNSRRGVVVAEPIAQQYGWQTGDLIPIRGDIWPREDGSWDWEFELVGTYTIPAGHRLQPWFLLRYDYFNDSVMSWVKHQVGWVIVRLQDQVDARAAIETIDGLFEHSSDPTKTMLEDDYARQFAAQLGNISLIATMILGAVFFTVLLLTANVASLAYSERITALAILKTLGYRDGKVSLSVFAETSIVCLTGALAGVLISYVLEAPLQHYLAPLVGGFQMSAGHAVQAIGLAVALSVVIGMHPAAAAHHLSITDALREQT